MKELVVGLANSVHDGAIALCSDDGVFAEAFERHLQVKRALGCAGLFSSWRPLRLALRHMGIDTTALQRASLRTTWEFGDEDFNAMRRALSHEGSDDGYLAMIAGGTAWDSTTAIQLGWLLRGEFPHVHPPLSGVPPSGPGASLRFAVPRLSPVELDRSCVPHHLAHAANAVYTSPFERCVALVIDGAGERTTIDVFSFADDTFRPISSTSAEHSLGHLYSAITQLCGFQYWEGEEWKVMGMAAHGERVPALYQFFHERTHVDGLQVKLALGPSWREELFALLEPGRGELGVLRAANLVKALVPAVVHLDGTGRLQSVTREKNALFHGLLSAFERQTGIPVLVNTSYNVMGKPISHSATDVLTVFATTGLHALVVGPWLLRKRA